MSWNYNNFPHGGGSSHSSGGSGGRKNNNMRGGTGAASPGRGGFGRGGGGNFRGGEHGLNVNDEVVGGGGGGSNFNQRNMFANFGPMFNPGFNRFPGFPPGNMIIRLKLRGRVIDNNLGRDRFNRFKSLRSQLLQTTNPVIARLCLEVLTVHGTELRLVGAKAFPLLIINVAHLT